MRRCGFLRAVAAVGLVLGLLAVSPLALAQEETVNAADKQLLAAHGFFERGMLPAARDEYEAFLTKYPDHKQVIDARYALAICHYRLGQHAKAIERIDQVIASGKFKQMDEAYAVLGHCQLQLKEYDKALKAFDQLLSKYNSSKHAEGAALSRAQVLYMLGRKDESLKASDAFLSKYTDSPRRDAAGYFKSRCLYDLKQFDKAEASLKALLKESPESRYRLDAQNLLGQCQNELGEYDDAAQTFLKFIAAAPANRQARGRYGLAIALYQAGGYVEAIEQLKVILDKHAEGPFSAPALYQLGVTQLAAGDNKAARKTLEKVAKDDKLRATPARYWISQCHLREAEYAEARKILDALVQQKDPKPNNLEQIAFDRALCLMKMEKFAEAAGEFGQFRSQFSKAKQVAQAAYFQAFCLHKVEKYDESLTLCKTIGTSPQAAAGLRHQALSLVAENQFLLAKYEEAAKTLDQLRQQATDDDEKRRFTFRRGQCASFLADYTRAIELLKPLAADEAVLKDERLQDAVFVLGDCLLQTEQYAEAATSLAQYIKLTKRNRLEAQFKLGLSQLRSGAENEAKQTLKAVSGQAADSPWVQRALFEYGQLTYNGREPAQARPALEKVLAAKAPESLAAPAMYLLAWIDFDANKYKPAGERFGKVVQQYPKHELAGDALYQQALALKLDEQIEPALGKFEQYLGNYARGEHAGEARYHAGACLAKLGRHDEAIKQLTLVAADDEARTDHVLYDLAWSQRATENASEAAKSYRRLLLEFNDSPLAAATRAELAELLYNKAEFDEAVTLLAAALADAKIDATTKAVAQFRLGWCYVKLDKVTPAAAAFEAFVKDNPKHDLAASAHYQAGEAYTLLNKLDEAETHYAAVVKGFPDYIDIAVTRVKLGQVQNQARQFDRAAATFNAFLSKHPDNKYLYLAQFGLGWSFSSRKQYEEARKWYEKVTNSHNGPTAARAQFEIGETHFAEQQFEKARKELLKVEIVYDYPQWSAKALYEAGRAYEQLQDNDQARQQYKQCVTRYGKEPVAAMAQKRLDALK